jgi:hypothetical protein
MTLAPDHSGAYLGVADLLVRRGWTQAALVVMDTILQHAPTNPVVRRRAAEMRLMFGKLADGWDLYDESRLQSTGLTPRPEPPPYWRGEAVSGKKLLIWCEQGLGDEVLYAGIIPDVVARGARCTIISSNRMTPVFERSFRDCVVRSADNIPSHAGTEFDLQIAAGSLGRYLRRDFADFPTHSGYLRPDPNAHARLKRKYEALAQGRRIVGLAWKSRHTIAGSTKSAELINLDAILAVPGVMFVNLQYGDCAAELAEVCDRLGVQIYQDPDIDSLTNVDDFFAQVAAMDLVISTSNSAVHIAGSMNVPTWLLLPNGRGALWYWFLRREDSPWYPSVKIFRASDVDRGRPWESETSFRAGTDLAQWLTQPRASV